MEKRLLIASIIAMSLTIGACSSTQGVKEVSTSQSGSYDPINDPKSPVYQLRSVYFDFDEYTIQPKYIPLLQAHANYLKANKDKKLGIVIQGNTDDRGTSEYNLALGQRRSEAVKKNLILLGVDASQLESVSFGKEKPKNNGHDESAWKENRRADIVYK